MGQHAGEAIALALDQGFGELDLDIFAAVGFSIITAIYRDAGV
jgi:hypothetical protein